MQDIQVVLLNEVELTKIIGGNGEQTQHILDELGIIISGDIIIA